MSLRPCRSCGRVDPRRMIALMTHWFGRYADVPPGGGYFYLCPACHGRLIDPHLQEIRHKLETEHPALRRLELPWGGLATRDTSLRTGPREPPARQPPRVQPDPSEPELPDLPEPDLPEPDIPQEDLLEPDMPEPDLPQEDLRESGGAG